MEIKEYTEFKADEILQLYTQVGWTAYTELLGIVRVVGDGTTIVLVQDILVYPARQRQGIGTALLKAVLERYKNVRQIQLVTDNTPKTVAFYKSLGFLDFAEFGCCGFMRG